ncbi:LysR family transcriptional regulator [Novosphingobium sp.]|uniref:LysR family transcriptional regulator n=1 Tax=Novosphingobium sp. TaxID=1874826 RepID=UPI0031CFCFB8
MDRIDLFRIFCRVVDCASFTRAADQLGLPRSSVSLAVRDLEARLGTRLLHRTTRKIAPTQDGLLFYERSLTVIAQVEDAEGLFRQDDQALTGRVHVDMPGRIGRLIVAPALPEFLDLHPGVDIILGVSDRAANLIEDALDCVLRVGPLVDSSLVARPVGQIGFINVASPVYLARHGVPQTPADLDGYHMVLFASPTTGRVEPFEWLEGGKLRSRRVRGRVTVNSAEAAIAACVAGLGLLQIPAYDVRAELAAGTLTEVLPAYPAEPMPAHLLFPRRRDRPRRVLAFADWLEGLLSKSLW